MVERTAKIQNAAAVWADIAKAIPAANPDSVFTLVKKGGS